MIEQMQNGKLYLIDALSENSNKPWNAHQTFKGVYLKHFVTGIQTNGRFSTHLVKIEPGCILDNHIHEGKTEMHEVVKGCGVLTLKNKEYTYAPGDMAIIPENVTHKVVAGDSGLYLLAKFVPALL